MTKKSKNILNKKIKLEIDDNLNGFSFGVLIGGIGGLILSFIFKMDLGFAYGIGLGMIIGLLVDIHNGKKKKQIRKNKSRGTFCLRVKMAIGFFLLFLLRSFENKIIILLSFMSC